LATNEGDEEDWRFGNIRFSMIRRESFDDWQLRDHHWPGQYGYGRNFAAPHSHHFLEWLDWQREHIANARDVAGGNRN
jgi:hypothetical protein